VERGEESCVDVSTNREVERQLKQRGQPIRLFGETDRQRMARLKLLELREEELSGGQRNDFNELLEQENEGSVSKRVKQSDDMAAFASIKDIPIRIDRVLLLKDRELAIKTVLLFLRILLKEWQCDLDGRPDETKKSTAGRMVSATFQQTKDYLVPFFKMLQSDDLPADILAHLVDIIGFLQQSEYVRANDTYLRLSIGNAPWPIGVTMVGIHERSAHEKINSGTVAHALNDEVTRKWIQSIKRLMTFCQKAHPPSDSSKAMG
jgi:pre-mRNA-splicing factor 18